MRRHASTHSVFTHTLDPWGGFNHPLQTVWVQMRPAKSGSKLFDTLNRLQIEVLEKVFFKKKKSADDRKACKITQHSRS